MHNTRQALNKRKRAGRRVATLLFAAALMAGPVSAQVGVTDTNSAIGGFTFTPAQLGGFDPTGADKLVVTTADENGSRFTSVTYDGTNLSMAVERNNSGTFCQIWYLDFATAATQGDLVLAGGGSSSAGVSILAMTNTAAGFVTKATAGATSISFDPVYDGSAVVAAFAGNGDGNAIAQSPLTALLNGTALGGGSRGGSGWVVTNAGSDTFSFSAPGAGRPVISIVSFATVGEDATPPGVSSTSATDDVGSATNSLLTDAVLTINFSEAVVAGSGSILLKRANGTTAASYDVSSATQLDFDAETLTITPDILAPSTSYYIEIPNGAIEDGSGNSTNYPNNTLTIRTGPFMTIAASGKSTYTTNDLRNFDPTGYDRLVAIVMDENGSHPSAITWGGTGLTQITSNANSIRRVSMWHLDGPFSGPSSLVVSGIGTTFGVSLLALPGVQPGVAASNNASATSFNFTKTSDYSFVVAGYTANGGGTQAFGDAPLTTYFSRDVTSSDGASGAVENSTTGAQNFSFSGNTSSPSLVIAEFVRKPRHGIMFIIR